MNHAADMIHESINFKCINLPPTYLSVFRGLVCLCCKACWKERQVSPTCAGLHEWRYHSVSGDLENCPQWLDEWAHASFFTRHGVPCRDCWYRSWPRKDPSQFRFIHRCSRSPKRMTEAWVHAAPSRIHAEDSFALTWFSDIQEQIIVLEHILSTPKWRRVTFFVHHELLGSDIGA